MNQKLTDLQAALLQHGPMLERVARALVRDEHYAQDLVQETWARAVAGSPDPRPAGVPGDPSGLRGWLLTTMRNLARSGARHHAVRVHGAARTRDELGLLDLEAKSAAETAERPEAMGRVHAALISLHEPLRSTLRLRFDEALSSSEVGARMGVAPSTVRSRIKAGLEIMRAKLDADFGGFEKGRQAWCATLVPLTRLRLNTAVPTGASALGAWTVAVVLLALGGGALGMEGLRTEAVGHGIAAAPEAGLHTDAYGRLPILQEGSDQPIARFVFANAPLVPLVSVEFDADALRHARSAPLKLEAPYTASVHVKLVDAAGGDWVDDARLRLRLPRDFSPRWHGAFVGSYRGSTWRMEDLDGVPAGAPPGRDP